MTVGVIADLHGNFEAMRLAMARHPEVPFWLCVGDVASRNGVYPEPPVPLYWIKGNNEDFHQIAAFEAGTRVIPNLHFIPNGRSVKVGPLAVAGLGGTYAPSWYNLRAADLPYPGHITPAGAQTGKPVRDDKRRHFVREQVDAVKALRGIDVFLTHEAPRPFLIAREGGTPAVRPHDAGKTPVNEAIGAMRPRLHLCGHHHRFAVSVRQGVPSICVDRISRSYLLVESDTMQWQKVDHPQAA